MEKGFRIIKTMDAKDIDKSRKEFKEAFVKGTPAILYLGHSCCEGYESVELLTELVREHRGPKPKFIYMNNCDMDTEYLAPRFKEKGIHLALHLGSRLTEMGFQKDEGHLFYKLNDDIKSGQLLLELELDVYRSIKEDLTKYFDEVKEQTARLFEPSMECDEQLFKRIYDKKKVEEGLTKVITGGTGLCIDPILDRVEAMRRDYKALEQVIKDYKPVIKKSLGK